MGTRLSRRRLFIAAPALVLLLGGGGLAARMMSSPPSDLDLSLSKPTEAARYVATIAADVSPIPVGSIHTWTVTVTTPDGKPAIGVAISIDGGMPQHGHGLPTAPKVTADLGHGAHRIDGMKFSMSGWWTITVSLDGQTGPDRAIFNLVI
jgi:hypothetical protein